MKATIKEVPAKNKFPLLARYIKEDGYKGMIGLFTSDSIGTIIVEGLKPCIGHHLKGWIPVDNTAVWEVLPSNITVELYND